MSGANCPEKSCGHAAHEPGFCGFSWGSPVGPVRCGCGAKILELEVGRLARAMELAEERVMYAWWAQGEDDPPGVYHYSGRERAAELAERLSRARALAAIEYMSREFAAKGA